MNENAGTSNLLKELEYYKERALEVMIMGDMVGDGVMIVDNDSVITEINDTLRKWWGGIDEYLGKKLGELHAGIGELCCGAQQHGQRVSEIVEIKAMPGDSFLITANCFASKRDSLKHSVIIFRDLTVLNRLRQEVEQIEKDKLLAIGELEKLREELNRGRLVYRSESMMEALSLANQVAATDVTILLEGETGTGKEVMARYIYEKSDRRDMPFVKTNCAAIPENLLESELFGYVRGSFTGALNRDKAGLFETANKGTILLDEIGELPINLQAKLLRVIQEREIPKIGSTKPVKIDVRIIAATNRSLEGLVAEGKFRQDLFYRLSVVPIHIPALRDRREDIPMLVNTFLERFNDKHRKNKSMSIAALVVLERYGWPGNVRELENVMERVVLFGNNTVISEKNIADCIGAADSRERIYSHSKETGNFREQVYDYEKHVIENALRKHGSTRKAAAALGITQSTIMRKMKLFNIVSK